MTEESLFIFDCHLDLSMNAIEWNRDLKKSVYEIRDSEMGMTDKLDREVSSTKLKVWRLQLQLHLGQGRCTCGGQPTLDLNPELDEFRG